MANHGQPAQDLVVDGQAVRAGHVGDLVVGTADRAVLGHLPDALKAEGVAAREGQRLLVLVVVGFETHAAVKYRIHLI